MVKRTQDGRTSDLELKWFINTYGEQWEEWRKLGSEWLKHQDKGLDTKLGAIALLFEHYFAKTNPHVSVIPIFFEGNNGWLPSTDDFKEVIINNTNRSDTNQLVKILNYCKLFVDYVLDTHLSEIDDYGVKRPIYSNPFEALKNKQENTESVHNPLPYRYICDLRHILCPNPKGNFSDWKWAHVQTGNGSQSGDWFEVNEPQIDKSDPDCVWRKKSAKRSGKNVTIHQIWSPVAAMTLFLKLHLPLRTYQVRMLDSGEADEMRYENGKWVRNNIHSFAIKGLKKGVFRSFKDNATGLTSTGFYINTNKTADQNKDDLERGYSIPWQNEEVLYWLEKLRNWQEKYNPIERPVDCKTLLLKHTKAQKSKTYLDAMGHISFLMRDAAASNLDDREKPITDPTIQKLWYKLLNQLEENLLNSGETISNGEKLKLVHEYPEDYKKGDKKKTYFPLHSLRVSLITSYVIDAQLPLPVVSKLLAGHSRLIMTIYYTKLTPSVMKEKMNDAQALLEDKEQQSIRTFLKDSELRQIQSKTAYSSLESIEVALVNRNPVGWENRHLGLCLAGGNTARSDESKTVAGCWNGGDLIRPAQHPASRAYAPVAHGPENCTRCRWFITDARYLSALNSHLNFMSYKAHEAANLSVQIESEIEALEEEKYTCESQKKPFTKHSELQKLQRRHEKQVVESDEYTKDFLATFKLIKRLIEIEKERIEGDTKNKLVAVGSENDIKLGFIETQSELFQLSLLCKDAEVYPEMLDDIKKTPVIERTTQKLSRIMMKKGYMPHLLMMNNEQQMIAANAMMREMAFLASPDNEIEGYQIAANYLEMEEFLKDSKLLEGGLNALENKSNEPLAAISVKTLLKSIDGGLKNAD